MIMYRHDWDRRTEKGEGTDQEWSSGAEVISWGHGQGQRNEGLLEVREVVGGLQNFAALKPLGWNDGIVIEETSEEHKLECELKKRKDASYIDTTPIYPESTRLFEILALPKKWDVHKEIIDGHPSVLESLRTSKNDMWSVESHMSCFMLPFDQTHWFAGRTTPWWFGDGWDALVVPFWNKHPLDVPDKEALSKIHEQVYFGYVQVLKSPCGSQQGPCDLMFHCVRLSNVQGTAVIVCFAGAFAGVVLAKALYQSSVQLAKGTIQTFCTEDEGNGSTKWAIERSANQTILK